MPKGLDFDFCLEIDFDRNSINPDRVFNTLSKMIQTFQQIDLDLVKAINSKIKPVILLEDVEIGSIKVWLKNILESVDDDAIKTLNWKQIVGQYLLKSKKCIINFLDGKTTINDSKELEPLKNELFRLAKETDVMHIPSYSSLSDEILINAVKNISESTKELTTKDIFKYKTIDGEATFNIDFHIAPENIDEILTKETIENTSELILKVRKPDYLGDSQWEFKHNLNTFFSKIEDTDWLSEFHEGKLDIRPGDAIRALVKTNIQYSFNNEVLQTQNTITKILGVIKSVQFQQEPLI